jgi:hypothetical protein
MTEQPANCRNRLRDEGQPYPKSGCAVCHTGGMFGCPYEASGAQSKPPAPLAEAPSRIHFEEDTVIINGKVYGKGWLLLSEDEYAGLCRLRDQLVDLIAKVQQDSVIPLVLGHDKLR